MAKLSRNLEEYEEMTEAESWKYYRWGVEMLTGSTIYRYESENYAVMVGLAYDDTWCCEVAAGIPGGEWDCVGMGEGWTPEEAIGIAEAEWGIDI